MIGSHAKDQRFCHSGIIGEYRRHETSLAHRHQRHGVVEAVISHQRRDRSESFGRVSVTRRARL
jgi:hypothetical protein